VEGRSRDSGEEADPLVVDQNRFVDEIDDIFRRPQELEETNGGSEATEMASATAADDELAAEDAFAGPEVRQRRRRRRRGRRRRRDDDAPLLEPSDEAELEDEVVGESGLSVDRERSEHEPSEASEEAEPAGRRRRPRWRRGQRDRDVEREKEHASRLAEDEDEDETSSDEDELGEFGEDDDGGSAGRPRHKKIPSWSEAIEVIVAANLANHERGGGRRNRRPPG
jgi:hypothetical protein